MERENGINEKKMRKACVGKHSMLLISIKSVIKIIK
jgi:hypothetical protein